MSLSTISPAPAPAPAAPPTRFFAARTNALLCFRWVHDAATLPWLRDALAQLDERPGFAAGVRLARPLPIGSAPTAPALVLVWCLPDDLPVVQAALTPLDPITGRCEIGVWPGRVVDDGQWHDWAGIPHRVTAESSAEAVPDWLRQLWVDAATAGLPPSVTAAPAPECEPAIDLSLITTAEALKLRVAAALRQAGQIERAEIWERETAENPYLNGLLIKARSFVRITSPLPQG